MQGREIRQSHPGFCFIKSTLARPMRRNISIPATIRRQITDLILHDIIRRRQYDAT
jgi:hypothetical protein